MQALTIVDRQTKLQGSTTDNGNICLGGLFILCHTLIPNMATHEYKNKG